MGDTDKTSGFLARRSKELSPLGYKQRHHRSFVHKDDKKDSIIYMFSSEDDSYKRTHYKAGEIHSTSTGTIDE